MLVHAGPNRIVTILRADQVILRKSHRPRDSSKALTASNGEGKYGSNWDYDMHEPSSGEAPLLTV